MKTSAYASEQNALAEAEDEDAIELEEEADRAALAEEFAEKVRIEADSKVCILVNIRDEHVLTATGDRERRSTQTQPFARSHRR